jgi:hypothetical protein
MKKTSLIVALAGILVAALAMPAVAADKEKDVTINGDGKCAKCELKESDKCQSVIQTKEDGKTVTYYLADNKIAKDFHENICQDSPKVKATGKLKEENGKKILTLSKIEIVKDKEPAAKEPAAKEPAAK